MLARMQPWVVADMEPHYVRILDISGHLVAQTLDAEDATLIVRAVNAHDALVAALVEVEQLIDQPREGGWHYNMAPIAVDTIRRVRAALALAQEV